MTRAAENRRFPLTVVILTWNEAENIAACLGWLDWVDDVVLVDSGSTDETIERALETRGDLRVFVHPFRDFGDQRNWAIDETAPKHDWILFLDADEHCNPACQTAVRHAVSSPGECVGFYLCCRNMFLGRWIKHCTLFPSWQLRLLKHGEVRYCKAGHGQREVTDGPLAYISAPYDHYGFSKGIEQWIDRHNEYSSNEVSLIRELRQAPLALGDIIRRDPVLRRRCLKRLAARGGFRPWLRFLYLYFIRMGFLDGRAGLTYCQLCMAHEIHITAKIRESTQPDCPRHMKGSASPHGAPDPPRLVSRDEHVNTAQLATQD